MFAKFLPINTNFSSHKSCSLHAHESTPVKCSMQRWRNTSFLLLSPKSLTIIYLCQLRNLAFKKIPQKSGTTTSCMTLSGIASDLLNPESRDPNAPAEGWQQWKQRDEQVREQLEGIFSAGHPFHVFGFCLLLLVLLGRNATTTEVMPSCLLRLFPLLFSIDDL